MSIAEAAKGLYKKNSEGILNNSISGGRAADSGGIVSWEKNPKFEETFAEFKKYYGEHCLDHTKPYPDIMHLLTELKARGVKTAIVSNKLDSAVKELFIIASD